MRCRIYRLEPFIDMRLIGKTSTDIDIWEGPLPFPAEEYEKFFYHKYGAGSYKVIVEEQGLSGIVCDIWFTLPDRDTYPPKIDDRTLIIDKAKDYIDWRARLGNPVAGQEPVSSNQEEDDFMELGKQPSTAAALVGGFVDLAKGQIQDAKEQAREAKEQVRELQQQPNAEPDIITHAASESIKLIADTSREMMKNSNAPDPVEMVRAIVGLLPPTPAPPDQRPMFEMFMNIMKQSNDTVAAMQQQTIQRLENRLSERAHNPSTAVVPVDGGMAEIERFQKLANLLGYSRGDGGGSAEPKKTTAETMQEWMPIIQMGMGVVQTIVTAVTAPKPAATPAPQPGVVPAPAAAPAPVEPAPDSPQAQMLKFLQRIEKPFLSHLLSPNFTGFDFAQHLLTDGNGGSIETNSGRAQYNQIKQNLGFRPDGTVGLDMLIRSYPPIWEIAKGDLPSYKQFLTEFFNYDEQVEPPAAKAS